MTDLTIKIIIKRLSLQRRRTCGDAEVRLVGRDVVDAVVLAGEDDVVVLQEHHPARQAEIRVRPLVNLVGQGHEDGQCKQVAVPGVDTVHLRCRRGRKKICSAFVFETKKISGC